MCLSRFQMEQKIRQCGWGHSRNTSGLSKILGPRALQAFDNLMRQTANEVKSESRRDSQGVVLMKTSRSRCLCLKVACIEVIGQDSLEVFNGRARTNGRGQQLHNMVKADPGTKGELR